MSAAKTLPPLEELRRSIKNSSAEEFVSHQILDRTPWLFDSRSEYERWKRALATEIGIDPLNLLVIGSACVGRSLAPNKNLQEFSRTSDIDLAIVSGRHFDIAWKWLRDLGPADLWTKTSFEREMLDFHRRGLVFNGTIATDRLLARLEFGPTWSMAFGRASNQSPVDGRDINARIYRDFESLRTYHVAGVRKLQMDFSVSDLTEEDPAASSLRVIDED